MINSGKSGGAAVWLLPIVALLFVILPGAIGHPPTGIGADNQGNVYFVDVQSQAVFRISASGEMQTLAGSGKKGWSDKKATQAQFNGPHSLTVDAKGNLFIGDYEGNRVRSVSASGKVSTIAGDGLTGCAPERMERPSGLAVDRNGTIYVTQDSGNRIFRLEPSGKQMVVTGPACEDQGQTRTFSSGANIREPRGIAVDRKGTLYVTTGDAKVVRIGLNGRITTLAGGGKTGFANGLGTEALFSTPWGLAVDAEGSVYVADTGNQRIRKITADGVVSTYAGTGDRGRRDGAATQAMFEDPCAVAVDASGNLYILESWGVPHGSIFARVRKIDGMGQVSTLYDGSTMPSAGAE